MLNVQEFDTPKLDFKAVIQDSEKWTNSIFDTALIIMEEMFSDAYFYNFFKRKRNCEKLSKEVDRRLNIGQLEIDLK